MTVTLNAIKFNHDSSDASTSALNIRKNAQAFIDVPEWVAGESVTPEDSRAAYGKAETAGNRVTIHARFSWAGFEPDPGRVEIRAIDATVFPPRPAGWMALLLWFLRWFIRLLFGNVLGEVRARRVTFSRSGVSEYEPFELVHTRLHSAGVGIYTTTWRWQYRRPGMPWTDFETTTHRIYVLLRTPTAPWQQLPHASGNAQLPWTDVLDRACFWAALSPDATTAATRITDAVYKLGNSVLTYDCPNGGSAAYAFRKFDCTALVERLAGGRGNGPYVNCTDCATIVSTFANAVGCDLWASRIGYHFDLNPLLAIGSSTWKVPCGFGRFSYHEVAWVGACAETERIYDACLVVDGDPDPTKSPHTPLLPANIVFGTHGSGDYRDRLSPDMHCHAHPETRLRRAVF